MQLVQSNDRANRLSFKGALAHKVEAALSAPEPETPNVKDQVLLVPENFEELSETDLHFTLMHNKELKHSRQSANLALDIIKGRVLHPKNVSFQTIELTNPVPVPQFAHKIKPVRSLVKPITGPDLTESFKAYVREFEAHRDAPERHTPTQIEATILLPTNYKDLSEDALQYEMTHHTELAHSHESARFAIDIIKGRIPKPEGVTFQFITEEPEESKISTKPLKEKVISTPVQPREIEHRNKFKQYLADKMEKSLVVQPVIEELPNKIVLVPVGYESMTEGELHFALVRNPELKHSQESARRVLDLVKDNKENVQFVATFVTNLAPPISASTPKAKPIVSASPSKFVINRPSLLTRAQIPIVDSPEKDQRVLKIPHNYEELNETQLHFALSHNREYGHSYESTYETLDILYGRLVCPNNTVFSTVEVAKPVERAY
jgi:hypothetical protein